MINYIKNKYFIAGAVSASILWGVTLLIVFLVRGSVSTVAGIEDSRESPPPQISSIIRLQDEIVIRGLKFGSKGSVCYGEGDCSELQLVSWGSSAIKAKLAPTISGGTKIWVVTGTNLESNKFELNASY